VSEAQGECAVLIHCSMDVQAITYGLMVVRVDLVGGLSQPAFCLVAPPTGYHPARELVGD
jgi:hypothetical protein